MPLQALFFDAAGTLVRPAESVGKTYAQFALRQGVVVESEAVMQAFRDVWRETPPPLHPPGHSSPDDDRGWWQALVGTLFTRVLDSPLETRLLEGLFSELYQHYEQPQAWSVFDDVAAALADLSRDYRLLVLSNFDRRLRTILGGHGLLRYFEQIVISSEVGAAKPDPRMFHAALAAARCAPAEALHIGDDLKCDLAGARNCGIQAFHVTRPENGLAELVQKVRSGAYSGLRSAHL